MNLDRIILSFAGAMVLLSLALAHYVDGRWAWLAVFVGCNLLQTGFTGFCPAALLLRRLGVKPGCTFK